MRIIDIKFIDEYFLEIYYEDGTSRRIDVRDITNAPIYQMGSKYIRTRILQRVNKHNVYYSWSKEEMRLSAEGILKSLN
jgi:hypothetical protein